VKALALGANGMLGFALFNYLNSKEKIIVIGTIKKLIFIITVIRIFLLMLMCKILIC